MDMSDVIKYPLSAAIELCEQLDNDETNYHLKMLEYKRERDEAREKAERYRIEANAMMMQRDEARESLKHIGEYGTEEINAAVELRQKLASALVERDEAREEIKEWKTLCLWGGTTEHIHGFIRGQQSRIQHLECERDEARIDAQKSKAYKRVLKETNLRQTERIRYLEGATNHACGTPLSVALRERNEAREEVKRLKVILDLIKRDTI